MKAPGGDMLASWAVVAYSGGKDSTAMLLWALERYQKVIPVFSDTKAEWPETYAYLDYVEQWLELPIVRLVGKFPGGLAEFIAHYKFWPSAAVRSCTTHLKRQPLLAWLRGKEGYDLLFGQRAEESWARAQLPEREPFREGLLLRPILRWTKAEVIDYVQEHGLKLNPVYVYVERANCCVCPLTKPSAIREYARRYPEDFRRWLAIERATGKTWRARMSLSQAAQVGQGSLFDTQEFSSCLLDGLCDLSEGIMGSPAGANLRKEGGGNWTGPGRPV